MKRDELCYVMLNGKWRPAHFICSYPESSAARVRLFDDKEWLIKKDELISTDQYAEQLRQDFESANSSFVAAMRAEKSPVKAVIARSINMKIWTFNYRIKKAKELGVSLKFSDDAGRKEPVKT